MGGDNSTGAWEGTGREQEPWRGHGSGRGHEPGRGHFTGACGGHEYDTGQGLRG